MAPVPASLSATWDHLKSLAPPADAEQALARAQAWNGLAVQCLQWGGFNEALAALAQCEVLIGPVPPILINRGHAQLGLAQWGAAEATFRKAMASDPNGVEGTLGLARLYWELGDAARAFTAYGDAVRIAPRFAQANRGYACALLTQAGMSEAILFEEHLAIANRIRPDIAERPRPSLREPNPQRPLRIGWLSSDFRNHPVGRNIMAEFQFRQRDSYKAYCYADVARPDLLTDFFRSLSDGWHDICGLSDARVAEIIAADQIDILVITAGRFDGNRPGVAAYRSAPIIVSYHDGATSGMHEVDAWITDNYLHPVDTRECFTEALVRLPCFYFFDAPVDSPDVAPRSMATPPVIAAFGNPAKISPITFDLWARVLKAVPEAQLAFKYRKLYCTPEPAERMRAAMGQRGVDPSRLSFLEGQSDYRHHLASYNQADVMLDCFPFTGANTTFEAMWMGVPVVTLEGSTFVSRVSAALLRIAGMPELVAPDPDTFVATATSLLRDRDRMTRERARLRNLLRGSPIMNGPGHCAAFEQALRQLWQQHCQLPR